MKEKIFLDSMKSNKGQDFTKKIVIVVRKDIELWRVLNTSSHIAAYFGNKLTHSFDSGDSFTTKDNKNHPRNCQYPIVILEGSEAGLHKLMQSVRDVYSEISLMPFTRAMTETSDDEELGTLYLRHDESELELLGVGLFGDKEALKKITKSFKLFS